jgi:AcrR family transcriptional regulator
MPEGRSGRKRKAILDAAIELFLAQGYAGTTMDAVAAAAAVSKQTVYKHFADKDSLFVELVDTTVRAASDPVEQLVMSSLRSGDLRADLTVLARQLLTTVLQPRVLQVRRLVIGEANRFPHLARAFHELGPERTMRALAERLDDLAASGRLTVADSVEAAAQLNWLVLAGPINSAMMLGEAPSPAELDAHVDAAVETFLAAHAPRRARRR